MSFDQNAYACVAANITCLGNQILNINAKLCECPPSAPYFTGSLCVACNTPNFWHEPSKACVTCGPGAYYNASVHKCATCPAGTTFNITAYKCEAQTTVTTTCPSSAPFYDGAKCVSCYLPQYWNHDNNRCENCPSGQNYDVGIKRCTTCPSGYSFDFKVYRCIEMQTVTNTTTSTITPSASLCTSNNTFFDGAKCVVCYLPRYWNHDANRCESCATGSNYDVSLKRCLYCAVGYTFDFNKWTCVWDGSSDLVNSSSGGATGSFGSMFGATTTTTTTGTGSSAASTSGTTTGSTSTSTTGTTSVTTGRDNESCRLANPATPFFDGTRCVSCYLPQYWNHDTNRC